MDAPAPAPAAPELMSAAVEGLMRPRGRKALSPKWFYDDAGSELFERITELPEYYLARAERQILSAALDRLAAHVPEGAELVELGSGASVKTRLLLDGLPELAAYRPVDVSAGFLAEAARGLARDYPALEVTPQVGDFTRPLALPPREGPRAGFFPGSTLGNLEASEAQALLRRVRGWPGVEVFILGVDLVKDEETLLAAYDDAEGVTARFNLNLLARMNREIGTDFDLDAFAHQVVWDPEAACIEMHLASLAPQQVRLGEGRVEFAMGETIHTETSRKFTAESLEQLADASGWRVAELLVDAEERFAVAILAPD